MERYGTVTVEVISVDKHGSRNYEKRIFTIHDNKKPDGYKYEENVSYGGASSWNDLTDKPFGETTVKGDTLTWDGNTEGLQSVAGVFFLVSEQCPTPADMPNGYIERTTDGHEYTLSKESVQEDFDEMGFVAGEMFCVVSQDNFVLEDFGTFPKAGIYFARAGEDGDVEYTTSLTIPGYNGFETTTIKPIETKYLPEHLQFGTETKVVEGDTLTWDGNTEGLVVFDMGNKMYKVSDAVPTMDDLANGVSLKRVANDKYYESTTDYINELVPGFIMIADTEVAVISESLVGKEIEGIIFPEAGVYYFANDEGYTISLTIPNYTGFVTKQTVVKRMDEKYLPTLTSPSGKKFKLSVDDSGTITATEV